MYLFALIDAVRADGYLYIAPQASNGASSCGRPLYPVSVTVVVNRNIEYFYVLVVVYYHALYVQSILLEFRHIRVIFLKWYVYIIITQKPLIRADFALPRLRKLIYLSIAAFSGFDNRYKRKILFLYLVEGRFSRMWSS